MNVQTDVAQRKGPEADVQIVEQPFGVGTQRFLDVARKIYRDDPNWIAPLDMDMGDRMNPKKNPFFEHAEGTTFIAVRNGQDVGRCTAQIDRLHIEKYNDGTGFFGFLDTIDDPAVAKALLDAAADWLRKKGMKKMRGPMSLSINEEMGCLIDGFDTPPVILMPHHRRCLLYTSRLGLADRDADEIVAAAYLHDLGKASSYHLTALNVAEYDGHRVAAEKSYLTPSRLMAGVKLPDATVRSLNHMYERFDGKGFPDAMAGKEIPLGARVVAITDTYADLTQNPRNPYRKTLKPVEASDVLAKYKGAIFDNNLVDIFRHVVTGDDLKAKLLANRGSALIIDPDPEETTVLELRMIEQGFEVNIARTADQALKALGEAEFELVISEVDLQPIDGFALMERAQKTDGGRNATWVFLSSNTDRESIDRGFALGATDYVEKPVKAEILVAKLRKMMEQGSARGTAARGVSGSLEEMGFPELVQILAQGRKTGALKIRSGGDSGEIHFVGGDVYQASWGRLRAEDAFYAMCRLRTGEFSLDPNDRAEQRVIQTSAEGMLLEGMRRMDEDSRAG